MSILGACIGLRINLEGHTGDLHRTYTDNVQFNIGATVIPTGSSQRFKKRSAAEAFWWFVSASARLASPTAIGEDWGHC